MQKRRQTISQFYGITIEMEPQENYLPHVNARYGQHVGMFSTGSGELIDGTFPEKESGLVNAWILLHQLELKRNWERSLQDNSFRMNTIAPLV